MGRAVGINTALSTVTVREGVMRQGEIYVQPGYVWTRRFSRRSHLGPLAPNPLSGTESQTGLVFDDGRDRTLIYYFNSICENA